MIKIKKLTLACCAKWEVAKAFPLSLDRQYKLSVFQNPFSIDNYKMYTEKTNPKTAILEPLVYKIQPETMKSKIVTRFNSITKPCS